MTLPTGTSCTGFVASQKVQVQPSRITSLGVAFHILRIDILSPPPLREKEDEVCRRSAGDDVVRFEDRC
jgi:hypothetical protein